MAISHPRRALGEGQTYGAALPHTSRAPVPKASKRQAKLLNEERRAPWEQSSHSDPTNPQ